MERLSYVLDTNAVADYLNDTQTTKSRIEESIEAGHVVNLCQPVYYEVMRGLLKTNSTRKLAQFENVLVPQLEWLQLSDVDWQLAAELWVETSKRGKQLSDTDLLLAAITMHLKGILISADEDFNALSVRRENWRNVQGID